MNNDSRENKLNNEAYVNQLADDVLRQIADSVARYNRREARRRWVVNVSKLTGAAVAGIAIAAALMYFVRWLGGW